MAKGYVAPLWMTYPAQAGFAPASTTGVSAPGSDQSQQGARTGIRSVTNTSPGNHEKRDREKQSELPKEEFNHAEWQQGERNGLDPREMKAAMTAGAWSA